MKSGYSRVVLPPTTLTGNSANALARAEIRTTVSRSIYDKLQLAL